MKAALYFLKRELASVLLVMASFIPLFFMGSLLDILLTHFYVHVENGKAGLPTISRWVYESMAGHRFLSQEIMACFWVLMLILVMLNAFLAKDRQQFRIGFIYSFLFVWVLAISTAILIAFACIAPFDLLLARLEEDGLFDGIIHVILVVELMLIILIPLGLVIWRKASRIEKVA
jgi:magnesium-transporting ATPase (P-type)